MPFYFLCLKEHHGMCIVKHVANLVLTFCIRRRRSSSLSCFLLEPGAAGIQIVCLPYCYHSVTHFVLLASGLLGNVFFSYFSFTSEISTEVAHHDHVYGFDGRSRFLLTVELFQLIVFIGFSGA